MTLLEYVDRVFEDGGVLTQLGGRSVTEQHKYAISVAKAILHPSEQNRLSMLEADTGIGKSFGYLIPLMIYVAITPDFGDKKFIISTYTRQLQKQIYNEDIPFLRRVLSALELPHKQTIAIRLGRQSFFSISRVKRLCADISQKDPSRKAEMETFHAAVIDIVQYGSGIWADYIEDYGDFPCGVSSNDICLLAQQKNDTEAYYLHLEKASLASIIITNHHSILLPTLTGLADFDVEAIIVDEAHKISSICQEMFNYRLSINDLENFLNAVAKTCKSAKSHINSAIELLSKLKNELSRHPKIDTIEFIHEQNSTELFLAQSLTVASLNASLKTAYKKTLSNWDLHSLQENESEILHQFESYLTVLENWLFRAENQFQVSAFGVSKKHQKLSLATVNIRPSYVFGRVIQRITNNVILTSATLANAQKSISFSLIQSQLGLRKFEIIEQLSISPSNYAEMAFVLADKKIPSPVLTFDDDQVIFSPKWLANTVKMIKAAHMKGEPLLVLTVSHSESKLIASKLNDLDQVSVHEKGHSIKQYTADFIHGRTKILITSAGWEGLNLRTVNKTQLIKNVLITRIPFTPPNVLFEYALQVVAKTNPNIAASKKNIEWVDAIQGVVAKLKQGFGRGTRSPNDAVVIWIADSRMPHKKSDTNSVLLSAIPARFLNNYLNAEIFEQQQKDVFFI